MSWVLLVLIAVNLWALGNIIDKYVISKHIKNPYIPISIQGITTFLYTILLIWFFGIGIPDLFTFFLLFFIGILIFGAIILYFQALKLEEVSRVVPLFGLTPIFTLLIATFFLNEIFTLEKYAGIVLLIIGSLLISYKHRNQNHMSRKAIIYMLTASLIYAVSYSIIKYISSSMDSLAIFAFTELGITVVALVSFFLLRKEILGIYSRNKKAIVFTTLAGTLGFSAFLVFFAAISQGPVSLVNAMDNTIGFFILLYATLLSIFKPEILKEEIRGSVITLKLFAIAIIFAGAYLVSV